MNTNKIYPNCLRQYRLKLNLKQVEVAGIMKLDCVDRISRWENGLSIPSITNLFGLAIIYQTTPQELFPELWHQMTERIEQHDIIPCDQNKENQHLANPVSSLQQKNLEVVYTEQDQLEHLRKSPMQS